MKPTAGDDHNDIGTEWPRVLKIASGHEFRQSVAVAQLATKLCELEHARSKIVKQPKDYLEEAWELIQAAREHVSQPQTNAEYLMQQDGSDAAAEKVVDRILRASRIPFKKLCDADYNEKDDTVKFHGAEWKVYRSKRGFDDLVWDYWRDIGETRKKEFSSKPDLYDVRRIEAELQNVNSQIEEQKGALRNAEDSAKRKEVEERLDGLRGECAELKQRKFEIDLVNDTDAWHKRGEQKLDEWKHDGIPPNDFLALARFRRARDKRAANLKPKQKRKNRRTTVKSRVDARKHRTR